MARLTRGVPGARNAEGPLARRLRETGTLEHKDRLRLLLGLLVEGKTDEQIHAVYRHASNYNEAITQKMVEHARRSYGASLAKSPRRSTPHANGESSREQSGDDGQASVSTGSHIYLPGGINSHADAAWGIEDGSDRRVLFDVFSALLRAQEALPRYEANIIALGMVDELLPREVPAREVAAQAPARRDPHHGIPAWVPRDPWMLMAYDMGLLSPPGEDERLYIPP